MVFSRKHNSIEDSLILGDNYSLNSKLSAIAIYCFIVWQSLVIFALSVEEIPLAFWIVFFPFFLWLALNKPLNSLIFMFLFILLDAVPHTDIYNYGDIHTIPLLENILPFHFVIIFTLICAWIVRKMVSGRLSIHLDKIGKLVLLFLIIWFLNYLASLGGGLVIASNRLIRICLSILMYFVFIDIIDTYEKLIKLLKWMGFGTFIIICFGYYQLIFGSYTDYHMYNQLPYILHEHAFLGIYLPLFSFVPLALGRREMYMKIAVVLAVLIVLLLLPFTYKRGLMLGAVSGIVAVLILHYRTEVKKLFVLLAVLALMMIFFVNMVLSSNLVSSRDADRFSNKLEGISVSNVDMSGAMRVMQWLKAYEIVKSNPISGLSLNDNIVSNLGPYKMEFTLDNNYLYIAVYSGLIGLIMFLAVVYVSFKSTYRCIKKVENNPVLRSISIGLFGTLVSFMVGDIFESHIQLIRVAPYYMLFFAIVSMNNRLISNVKTEMA